MYVPDGWKLVPLEPNDGMYQAAHDALRKHLDSLSKEERLKRYGKPGKRGYYVYNNVKHRIRYKAMIEAAPEFKNG